MGNLCAAPKDEQGRGAVTVPTKSSEPGLKKQVTWDASVQDK